MFQGELDKGRKGKRQERNLPALRGTQKATVSSWCSSVGRSHGQRHDEVGTRFRVIGEGMGFSAFCAQALLI